MIDQKFENNQQTEKRLRQIAGEENVLKDEPLSRHTSFRIGGPADYFVTPESEEALRELLLYLREEGIPYYMIGNGTNLLAADEGYRGVIIQLYRSFAGLEVEGTRIRVQAGALLSAIAKAACRASLTGLEFASGIPGTLGGAAVMNAGAYGGELKDVAETVRVMDRGGQIRERTCDQMAFGYRTSAAAKEELFILGACLNLQEGDREKISLRMEELKQQRVSKQPLDLPSAGSTFKRPEGYFAGKLIMDAGLAGFSVGGAMVSPKHCGFVVNTGGASAADVLSLICQVQERVYAQFGVRLEPEVKMLGMQ